MDWAVHVNPYELSVSLHDDPETLDKILENDTFNLIDLESIAPGKPLSLEIVHASGSKEIILLNHTYNDSQIEWFKAGSALNLIKLMEN